MSVLDASFVVAFVLVVAVGLWVLVGVGIEAMRESREVNR